MAGSTAPQTIWRRQQLRQAQAPSLLYNARLSFSLRARSAGPKRSKRVSFDEGSRSLPLASPRRSSIGSRPVPDQSLMARIMSQLPDLDDYMLKQVRPRVTCIPPQAVHILRCPK